MASNQTMNLKLKFGADTSEAKKKLEELQQTLSKLSNSASTPSVEFPLTKNINEAIGTVNKLQAVLKTATTSAGTLDLGMFKDNLKAANLDVSKLASGLGSLGTSGVQAFTQLAQSVLTAEVPLKRTSTLLDQFKTTLMNTAKWQISSSILHGFMGAVQGAYGYAKDLNESLNNIRIVTGQTTDQMAQFAEQANKAAKNLGTTTTAYTDAALIFYQQGLKGEDVTQRTDTVIKLANVTKGSAEEVSSYMTAIWNNFYDGSESLEHYADVITALGAATASSSAEISQGLEKFAAIGNTVGLSYEYATTALATVVAQTRQSADTVGTAFKTLFARIQDLELGETLEDGTDLGKYSQALATIGVNIKDAKGEVKDMDTILNEMGSKWQTISKDTQIAVAQAVAGTRQYSQLVALMDNWDKFQENLNVASNAEGSLSKQAAIYEESWEAASKRLKASLQGLWKDLLDDEFFIKMTDTIAKVVSGLDNMIKSLGGVKTLLPAIGMILTQLFSKNFGQFLDNQIANFRNGTQQILQFREQFAQEISRMSEGAYTQGNKAPETAELISLEIAEKQGIAMMQIVNKKKELAKLGQDINVVDKAILDTMTAENNKAAELVKNTAKELELKTKEVKTKAEAFKQTIPRFASEEDKQKAIDEKTKEIARYENQLSSQPKITDDEIKKYEELENILQEIRDTPIIPDEEIDRVVKLNTTFSQFGALLERAQNVTAVHGENISNEEIVELQNNFNELTGTINLTEEETQELKIAWDNYIDAIKNGKDVNKAFQEFNNALLNLGSNVSNTFDEFIISLEKGSPKAQEAAKRLRELYKASDENSKKFIELVLNSGKFNDGMDRMGQKINEIKPQIMSFGQSFANLQSGMMGFVSTVNSIQGAINSLAVDEINPSSILGTISSLAMTGYGISRLDNSLKKFANSAAQRRIQRADTKLSKLKESGADVGKIAVAEAAKDKAIDAARDAKEASTGIGAATGAGGAIAAAAVAVIIAAVGAAIVVGIRKLKQNATAATAKELQAQAKEQTEKLQGLKEEQDQLTELSNKYKELLNSEQNIKPEEMRKQVYDLCIQYGQESLALQALAGDYTNLTDKIKDYTDANAVELNKQAENTKKSIQASLNATLNANENFFGTDYNEGQGLDLWAGTASKNEALLRKEIRQAFDVKISDKGILLNEDLMKMLEENPDKLKEIASKYQDAAPKLLKAINNLESEGILEQIATLKEAEKSALEASYSLKDDITKENYFDTMSEMIKKSIDQKVFADTEEGRKQARQWAKSCLDAISGEIHDYGEVETLANVLFGPEATAEQYKKLANLSDEEFQQINAHINLFKSLTEANEGNLDSAKNQFYKDYQLLIDVTDTFAEIDKEKSKIIDSENSAADRFNALIGYDPEVWKAQKEEALNKLNEAQKILEEQNSQKLSTWFSATGLKQTGDFTDQYNIYLKYQEEQQKYTEDFLNKIEDIQNDQFFQGYNDSKNIAVGKDIFGNVDITKTRNVDQLINRINLNEDYGMRTKVDVIGDPEVILAGIAKAYDIALTPENLNKILANPVSEAEKAIAYILRDAFDISGALFDEDFDKKIQNSSKTITEAFKELQSLDVQDISLNQMYKLQEELMASFNKTIDETKNAYNSLNSVCEDYNENGYLSIDSLKTLTSLGPQYLNTLIDENGQLNFNKDKYLEVVKAQYMNQASTMALALSKELAAATTDEEACKLLEEKLALVENTNAGKDLIDTYLDIAKAQASISGNPKLVQYYEAQATAIQSIINSANHLTLDDLSSDTDKVGKSTKEAIKYYDKEFDRFHDIKIAIEDLNEAMSDLERQKKHLAGGELISALEYENNLLSVQTKHYQDLASAQKKYQQSLQNELHNKYNVDFAGDGSIANYNQITEAAMSWGDEDKYSRFKDLLSDYENLLKDITDTENKIEENLYKQIENNLQTFELEIELDLDIEEARRKVNDFFKDLNDDFTRSGKTVKEWSKLFDFNKDNALSLKNTIGIDLDALKEVKSIIDNPNYNYLSEDSMFGSRSEALKKYQELTEQTMDDAKDLYDLYEDSWEDYLDAIDEVVDDWEKIVGEFEKLNSTLDHYSKIVDLLYGEDSDEANALKSQIYEQQGANLLSQINVLRQERDSLQEQYDAIDDKTTEDAEKLKEALDEANDNLLEATENYLENAKKQLQLGVTQAIQEGSKALHNGQTTSEVRERWDMEKRKNANTFDDTEREFQMTNLNTSLDKMASKATLQSQEKIKKFQDSLNQSLREKDKLTKADVEMAEKKIKLLEAEIALEEAQNNKNQTKLVRGTDGNWTYQYVADEDNILDKQQAVSKANEEWYETAKKNFEQGVDDILAYEEEFNTKLAEIMTNTTLTQEEQQAQAQKLIDDYYGDNGLITQAIDGANAMREERAAAASIAESKSFEDVIKFVSGDEGFKKIVDANAEAFETMDPLWSTSAANIISQWGTDPESVRNTIEGTYQNCIGQAEEYRKKVESASKASGIDFNHLDTAIAQVGISTETLKGKLDDVLEKTSAIAGYKTQIEELGTAWDTVASSVSGAATSLESYVKELKNRAYYEEKAYEAKAGGSAKVQAFEQNNGKTPPKEDNDKAADWSVAKVVDGVITSWISKNETKESAKTIADNFATGLTREKYSDSGLPKYNVQTYIDDKAHVIKVTCTTKVNKTKTETVSGGTTTSTNTTGVDGGILSSSYIGNTTEQVKAMANTAGTKVTLERKVGSNNIVYKITDGLGKIYEISQSDVMAFTKGRQPSDLDVLTVARQKYTNVSFATGGYTGDWAGSEGKLAVLHSKELVLNKDDTRNMLDTITALRDMMALKNNIKNSVAAMQMQSLMFDKYGNNTNNISNKTIEGNTFNIQASFPNATSVAEIQEAILSLPNMAAQFLHQK